MDLRALTLADGLALEAYLNSLHPANAVYFLERLTQYGINSPWGQFFGVRALPNTLIGIVMFDGNERECAVDWTSTEALPFLADFIGSHAAQFDYLIGQLSKVEPVANLLSPILVNETKRGQMYLLPPGNFHPQERKPVRRATPADAKGTLTLDPAASPPNPTSVEARSARLREYVTYVAEANGKIVSWAGTSLQFGPGANIGSVFTDPRYENQGYCKSCMTALCRELLPQVAHIYLSVADENDRAIRIYEKLGFVPLGDDVNPRLLVKLQNRELAETTAPNE